MERAAGLFRHSLANTDSENNKISKLSSMKSKCAAMSVLTMILALAFGCARMQHANSGTAKILRDEETKPITRELPPLPAGVTELRFSEFFVNPIGPLGLAFTDKLLKLDGQRVRVLGYMVRRESGLPGQCLFAALPVQLHDHDSSDDLPAALVHVSVPTCRDREVPFAPGLMLLTGTLSVGHREETDGRMSVVRLALDPPTASARSVSHASKGRGLQNARASSAR